MASKKKEIQLQAVILNQTQWDEMLLNKGLTVVDIYQAWCGPCKAVVNLFRRLKNEYGEDNLLHFAVAEADSVMTLLPFKDKCEPAFVFCLDGKMIDIVRGANGPLLNRKVIELIELERKIVAGDMQRPEMPELLFIEEKESEEEHEEEEAGEEEKCMVVIIKPDAVAEGKVEEIKQLIIEAGSVILAEDKKILTDEQVRNFYESKSEEPDFEDFVLYMLSAPSYILIISERKHGQRSEYLILKLLMINLKEMLQNQDLLHHCDIQDRVEETSRQLAFFFSDFSKQRNEKFVERTLALIRPSLLKERRESILNRIVENGFEIAMQKEITLSEEQAREFYRESENQDYFPYLLDQMTSGPTLALALVRENAIQKWRDLLGPKIIQEAKKQYPQSLRAEFTIHDSPINQLHGSANTNEATKELQFFFPVENTMALIKPSAFEDKDKIINKVKDAGFLISELREAHISPETAAQFYQDHEDKPYYNQLVDFMSKGPSMVMVLTKENAVDEWRQLMGPTDPTKAKETHPNSIRAKFATDIMHNAVHGSSNEEHAKKSINFIFGDIDLESLKYKYIYM
ncbi:thioredoxin domain-containing protein 3 [Notechis scutatus]|uniref:Thioredoxin domain-containing protein 3 n=1 Tax=Notechis scutatus TaxID=8663 RepID=A0A6J1UIG6_9SAUR|nr:thioredoxin domain-containing protein 3 [Notechis scutatus]